MSDVWETDEKWQALKARFTDRLTDRFEKIRGAWNLLEAGSADPGVIDTLFHLVHSLAGSAATFGYAQLSDASRQVEARLDPLHRPQRPLSDAELAAIGAELRTLIAIAHATNPHV